MILCFYSFPNFHLFSQVRDSFSLFNKFLYILSKYKWLQSFSIDVLCIWNGNKIVITSNAVVITFFMDQKVLLKVSKDENNTRPLMEN